MKRKFVILFLISILAFSSSFMLACLGGDNSEPSREISSKLLAVMDETFSSAEYKIAGETSSQKNSASAENINLCSLDSSEYATRLEELTQLFYGTGGGVPLTDDNVKALKGEALANGSTFASMARALIEVYGDSVFSECYSYQCVVFKMTGDNDKFAINGVIFEDNKFRSGFQMKLSKENDGSYSYTYVEYSLYANSNMGKTYTTAFLKISAFTPKGVLNTELESTEIADFSSYDASYDKFSLEKMTVANFDIDNYASLTFNQSTPSTLEQVEKTLKFSKEVLSNTNETFKYLKSIKSTKNITAEEANRISSIVNETYYVCPYYYQTNKSYVREEYTIPSDVTVVKTGSVPATKKVIIHGNVTKIESRPFQQPEYLEDIIFSDPNSNKLTEIGSFDYSTGQPSFILSMTKVKNFKLPSSVKKLELGLYILNTEVESLDLSSYDPAWLTDDSKFTYKYDNKDAKLDDYIKVDYRNSAYVKLRIGGVKEFNYKELRYINEIKMPCFNMGIDVLDTSHYSVKDSSGVEYYSEAHRVVADALKFSDITVEEFFASRDYTPAYECIGEIHFNAKNTIVSEDLLYSDVSDKEDIRDEFDIELYTSGDNADSFAIVKYVYVSHQDFFNASSAEQKLFNRVGGDRLLNDRVQILIDGANGLSFNGFEFNEIYKNDGQKVSFTDLKVGDKFYAPNVTGSASIKKIDGENRYFAGWSYTENGNVNVYPFSVISNNMQTLYPVYKKAENVFNKIDNEDGTVSLSFKGGNVSDGILVIPSEYNGKKVSTFVREEGEIQSNNVKVVVFTEGITTVDYNAFSGFRPDMTVFSSTIIHVRDSYLFSDEIITYGNCLYYPHGNSPFGVVVEIEDSDMACTMHSETVIIAREAFYGYSCGNISIPNGVKFIGDGAFQFSSIENVVIPSSVEYVGAIAFLDCDNLVSLEIKNGIKKLGTQCFSGCDNLKSVKLPTTLETLPSDVFEYCPNIEGNAYENGLYLSIGTNEYAVLIRILDPYVETFKVHDNTEFISCDNEESADATKIYLGKKLKEIALSFFGDFHNRHIVYYQSSAKDWNLIKFTGYEEEFTWQEVVNENLDYIDDTTISYNS